MKPIVSVIIPSFNRNCFLHSAVESVLNQTFQDFEVIVVDDASEVDVQGVIEGFHDRRIKYIRHEINKGEAGARNTGIINSNAEYIAFLDDDDMWFPEKLALQMNVLQNSPAHVGGIYSGFIAINGAKQTSHTRIPTRKGNIYQDLLVKNTIGTPSTVLIKRACIETAGFFDENIFYGVDHDFYLRCARHFHFEYIAEPLVQYNIHENSLTNNPEIVAKGLEAMSHKYSEEIGNLKSLRQRQIGLGYLSVGVSYCYRGEIKKGINAFLKSIRVFPFEPRPYLNLIFSLTGAHNFAKLKHLKDILVAPFRTNRTTKY